jgi:hypothetical protein
MTMFDKSNLPDLEEREKALGLLKAFYEASRLRDDADPHITDEEFKGLDDAADTAEQAYERFGVELMRTYDEDLALFCGMCGVALREGDEILEDAETGEAFLRAAVGLPPRKKAEGNQLELPELEGAEA